VCGICGIAAATSGRMELEGIVRRMAGTLAHRGPDGEGVWLDEGAGIALGHRRLAIIDLSPAAQQPMTASDGRYVLSFNGEIYNFRELRRELEAAGIRFRSQSDTEVLLESCARWGVAAATKRFNGIFAFALWDREARSLSLVRDHLGVKPLYWCILSGALLFGSELRALVAHPLWRPEINRDALVAYFRHGYIPTPHTIYKGVHKLAPGTLLTYRAGEAPKLSAYWDARAVAQEGLSQRLSMSEHEAAGRLEDLLRDAIGRQLISDVPLGAYLSGGIDSSLVVALAQQQSAKPLRTFTIGFRESGYDEAQHAAAVARHLRTDHTELYAEPGHARDLVPAIAGWFDEPFADASQLPTYLVSEMTRRHVTVALSGDGGDEVFAGYRRYVLGETWRRRVLAMPAGLRRAVAATLLAVPPESWDRLFAALPGRWRPARAGDQLHKIAPVLTLADENAIYRRLISQCEDPAEFVLQGQEPKGALWDKSVARDFADFIERMQFLDTVTYLPDDILTKVDRTSMAVSLEARVPLLDPRVVAFGWRLPGSMRVRGGKGKWILRQVLYRHVPRALVERPKMGFGVPIDAWLRGPLRDWAEDLLEERRLRSEGFLNAAALRRKWQEHLSGRRNWQYLIWCALMFQEWQRRWMDGVPSPQRASAVA